MAGLVPDQLLRNLRKVGDKQLITPVKVYRRTKDEGPYGTQESETLALTTVCWYKPSFKGDLAGQIGGLIGNDSQAEVRFHYDEDIRVGDRLEINGQPGLLVQDTTGGATIQLYLKAWTQVVE